MKLIRTNKVEVNGKKYQFVEEFPLEEVVEPSEEKIDGWTYHNEGGNPEQVWRNNDIYAIKSQLGELNATGDLTWWGTEANRIAQTTEFKAHSQEQYLTILEFTVAHINTMASSASKRTMFVQKLVDECVDRGLTGVELDLEAFWSWTATTMANMLLVINQLADSLHAKGKQLHMALPGKTSDAIDGSGGAPHANFAILAKTAIDQFAIMTYDANYQVNANVAPLAPLKWITDCTKYAVKHFGVDRVIGGIPNYSYSSPSGLLVTDPDTFHFSKAQTVPGFATATRDPLSGELTWKNAGKTYWVVDQEAMRIKKQAIKDCGVTRFSVWSFGGNLWF